jgi:hypothetical protein
VRRGPVHLPRYSYLVDVVCFPNPGVEDGAGPFTLLLRIPELREPLVVRFPIGRKR